MTRQCQVSPEWLKKNLYSPEIRIIDASWYLPNQNRNPQSEFEQAHIPTAIFFDIDEISDSRTELPHMLPSHEKFALRMRKLGIGDKHHIIVYDTHGLFSAARVWWMFRYFGHKAVSVLKGGFPAWQKAKFSIECGKSYPKERHFTGTTTDDFLRDARDIARILKLGGDIIVDARPAERFRGEAPEPRPGLQMGHIPGSRNLPFSELIENGQLKPALALRSAFENAGIDLNTPITTSCGSGVSAAILNLALEEIGHRNHALYDGSWAEWGAYAESAIETGPAKNG